MTFIPTIGCVRVDIQYDLAGQQVHNVIWCKRTSSWTDVQREDLAAAIEDWWNGTTKTYFPPVMTLQQITVVNQDSDSAPSTAHIVSPAIAGTGSGASLPNGTALVATLRTALRGRSYRGRMYLGGLLDTDADDSITVVLGYVTALLTVLGNLKTAIEALGAVWVVVSKFHNNLQREAGVATPINAISMDQYYDSQRRRLGLRGT